MPVLDCIHFSDLRFDFAPNYYISKRHLFHGALHTTFPVTPSLATTPSMAFSPYLSHVSPGMGLVPAELLPNTPVLVSGNPAITVPGGSAGQKLVRTDKLEVCREFQRGNCTRGENDCRYAHPIDIAMIDTNENTVTVCMDYIKGRCSREKCKYFHPPAHLQAKIKAAQHQVNQTAAAAMRLPIRLRLGYSPGYLRTKRAWLCSDAYMMPAYC
ncbi:unnamed protein product [Ranitomeya imitator]|uniref:C3H1-type domain-containing protein n=1 Tax=Ranitomeya imitator TaxID=111125 RepID=A0ABN9LDV7_9NEOB|nr:unnamed protein product [Ranitomeya imitator]